MNTTEILKNKLEKIEEYFKTEISSLRVGRATPALVENVLIDYYGVKTPVKQIASISAPEPRILVIEPWDKNTLPMIEKAIQTSNLGLNPIVDKNIIRIIIPQLTEERRNALIKTLSAKLEEAKIKIRAERDEVIKNLAELFNGKKITEDERFKTKEKIQELIDRANINLENLVKIKEREIKAI